MTTQYENRQRKAEAQALLAASARAERKRASMARAQATRLARGVKSGGRPPTNSECEVVRVMATGLTRVRCVACRTLYDRKPEHVKLRCACKVTT